MQKIQETTLLVLKRAIVREWGACNSPKTGDDSTENAEATVRVGAYRRGEIVLLGGLSPSVFTALMRCSSWMPRGWDDSVAWLFGVVLACGKRPNTQPPAGWPAKGARDLGSMARCFCGGPGFSMTKGRERRVRVTLWCVAASATAKR
ncbi:MAG: hypothetical protein ACYS9T_11380 [Planctomycetota bacterium]